MIFINQYVILPMLVYFLLNCTLLILIIPALINIDSVKNNGSEEQYFLFAFSFIEAIHFIFVIHSGYCVYVCFKMYGYAVEKEPFYHKLLGDKKCFTDLLKIALLYYLIWTCPMIYISEYLTGYINCYSFNHYTCYLSSFFANVSLSFITILLLYNLFLISKWLSIRLARGYHYISRYFVMTRNPLNTQDFHQIAVNSLSSATSVRV